MRPSSEGAAPASANFDALAVSISAQANAISQQANLLTLVALIVSLIALVGLIGWAVFVRREAQMVAGKSAQDWMDQQAPGIIAKLDAEFRARSQAEADAQAQDLAKEGGK